MSTPSPSSPSSGHTTQELESIVVRFAGDSGDGMQVTGDRFTTESALAGNDLATLPDFPAEIRAPAGTIAGVSGFQINFGSTDIYTPGDKPDVLVAMNPAALKANIDDLKRGGVLILNEDAFTAKNLKRVSYETNPCEDEKLATEYRTYVVPITKLTKDALADSGLSSREVDRCKNFFTLGIMLWMFNRPSASTIFWLEKKFAKRPEIAEANVKVLKAGMTFAEATEVFSQHSFKIKPAALSAGSYRSLNGTTATTYGLISAARKSGLPMFFAAYPITPASEILHQLSAQKQFGVATFQAEDEIAAICAAIGAAYSGALAVTSSSGPGIALKLEAMSLAVMVELPLVIIDVQRAGPSTGMPTKTEQADLFQALYGRPGESPLCVIAASSPETAFTMSYEACRIALKYMTPVVFLSDGYIANCSQPWKIPSAKDLPAMENRIITETNNPDGNFLPYARDEKTLARPWALPGTPGLAHRVGGLEKQVDTGNVNYQPDNHQEMTRLREEKIARIAAEIPATEVHGEENGDLLVIGWGGTEGTLTKAALMAQAEGLSVSRIHLFHLNPLPSDLGDIISRFKNVLVPEINCGQLLSILRNKYLVDARGLNLVRGLPLKAEEVLDEIRKIVQPH
jgi:2-oxoglutarate ferredoxin oxidoreductase subunit alpha